MPIDLRSDTVTRPTAAMREAMAEAPVGDDVYGEDPTVTALERAGRRAARATRPRCSRPTGSMANQLGVRLLVAARAGAALRRRRARRARRARRRRGASRGSPPAPGSAERGLLDAERDGGA